MKSNKIERNLLRINVLIIMVIIVGITASMHLLKVHNDNLSNNNRINKARILTSKALLLSKQIFKENSPQLKNILDNELKAYHGELDIIDLKGEVKYSSSKSYTPIHIESQLQVDSSFQKDNKGMTKITFPVLIDGEQRGNAIFILPYDKIVDEGFVKHDIYPYIPILIAAFISSILLLYLRKYLKKEIINPLKDLNKASEAIAKGDFSEKINHNDFNEIGTFAANFEFMRDELKNSLEKQKVLEKSRKELIACISHDLRTPLSSINAYVEGIRDGICRDEEMLKRYIDIIYKKTSDLSNLIQDLFLHSQIEAEELSINKKEVYSRELLLKILLPLKEQYTKQGINLIIEEPLPELLINVDEMRIEQVILNLLENSKKYSKEGKSIYFRCFKKEQYLVVEVKDEGIGIDSKDMPFIFDKFYRGEKSRNTSTGGAGLGLSICKYIVEKHGGRIYAEANIGEGSKFSFEIKAYSRI